MEEVVVYGGWLLVKHLRGFQAVELVECYG